MKYYLSMASIFITTLLSAADLAIDYSFIAKLEGGQKLVGYVPDVEKSQSGVTIATGVDLGARKEADLKALKLSTELIAKLKPYLGLKKDEAKKFLDKNKFTITKSQADELDEAVKQDSTKKIVTAYNKAISSNVMKFEELPQQAQTVIASVAFQYGNLAERTPKFWKLVTNQDWLAAVRILYNFEDKYPTRRYTEGDLLAEIAKDVPSIRKSVGKRASNDVADVKVVQTLLKAKSVYSGDITGKADETTIQAIQAFQKSIGTAETGVVEPIKRPAYAKEPTLRRLIGT